MVTTMNPGQGRLAGDRRDQAQSALAEKEILRARDGTARSRCGASRARCRTFFIALNVVVLLCAHALSVRSALAQGNTGDIMSDTQVFDPGLAKNRVVTDGNLMFKTKVLYRGLVPSTGPAVVGNFGMMYRHVVFYLYGGAGFTTKYPEAAGNYQETDLNVFYHRTRWDVGFNYFYNFTDGITAVPEPSGIFDFDSETGRAVLDLIGRIRFGKDNQWQFTSSTYVWGPRDSVPEQTIDEQGNAVTVFGDQRHSQYVEILKSWKIGERHKIKAAVGGSWAWTSDDDSTFYGDEPGINNIELTAIRYFEVSDKYVVPVKASVVSNPLSDDMYVYFTVELIHNTKIGH